VSRRKLLELLLNVLARRSDAHLLGRQHIVIKDGKKKLSFRPQKTRRTSGITVTVRITPQLQAALDAMPASDSLTFLVNDYGKPFASAAAFGNKFADWCREAGLKPVLCDDGRLRSYRAHGLRKAGAQQLAYEGASGAELMAVGGWKSLAQVQIYIEKAERERLADNVFDRQMKASEG
jgi:integrase